MATEHTCLTCPVGHLNMRPNVYNLNYKIDLNTTSPKDTCDSMNGACQLSVLNNAFYVPKVNLKEGRGYMGLIDAKFISE